MAERSTIQWTATENADGSVTPGSTWNPTVGCTKCAAGCDNCYAIRDAHRMAGNPNETVRRTYGGLTHIVNGRPNWTGTVRCLPERLDIPLHWRKPRRVFVDSQSDLFHPDVPDEFLIRVFTVMFAAKQHTFQVLTKRADRMADFCGRLAYGGGGFFLREDGRRGCGPLSNVWLGYSASTQSDLEDGIEGLLRIPAAIRFLSLEPLLGTIDDLSHRFSPLRFGVNWVIVGGESGPRARPCNVEWIRSIARQCRVAGVACFVKQLGRWIAGDEEGFNPNTYLLSDGRTFVPPVLLSRRKRPENAVAFSLYDSHGGDWNEWPIDLRVREFPE